MSIINPFRLLRSELDTIKSSYKDIISNFEEVKKENLILLEEIRMLKKLLYGIELDIVEKKAKKKK
jgi:hypothetical protein